MNQRTAKLINRFILSRKFKTAREQNNATTNLKRLWRRLPHTQRFAYRLHLQQRAGAAV